MNQLLVLLEKLYSLLVGLYPRSFRDEFGAEMQAVYGEALHEAQQAGMLSLILVSAREFLDFPINVWREVRHEFQKEGIDMRTAIYETIPLDSAKSSSPREALLAVLPFLLFGVVCLVSKWNSKDSIFLYAIASLFALTGLAAGGIRGFPRWSYTYLGWSVVFSWLWMMLRLDTLITNGPAVLHDLNLGPYALIPLFLALVIPLLWTRSLLPLARLFQGIWQDWTALSLALFTFAGYALMVYDENHHPYLFVFMILTTLVMAAAVWALMRSSSTGGRALALLAGFTISWVISNISYSTWDAAAYYGLPPASPQSWMDKFREIFWIFAIWSILLFWPAFLGFFRSLIRPRTH